MDLILIRLTPPATTRDPLPSPEIVADIVWANTVPDDRLEHIRARHGPNESAVDVAVFLTTPTDLDQNPTDIALNLCRRAVDTAPALTGWTATQLAMPNHATTWQPV